MDEHGTALKAGIARSGGEKIVKLGVSFEFGGRKPMTLALEEEVIIVEPEVEQVPTEVVVAQAIEPIVEEFEQYHQEDIVRLQLNNSMLEDRIEALESKPEPVPQMVQQPAPPPFTEEQKQAVYEVLRGAN